MIGLAAPYLHSSDCRPSLAPIEGRFIRLGKGQSWARRAIDTGTLRFGAPDEPHDLCLAGEWDGVERHLLDAGRSAQKASELRRQLQDFYTLGPDILWVTVAEGRLWWGFAEPEVADLRGSGDGMGIVVRRIQDGWSCRARSGRELHVADLASILSVRLYPGALCSLTQVALIWNAIEGC